MPAHGLKLSRDSGRSDQVEADGLLLESPNTYLNFYRYFRSVALGHYCYLKFFCPIHFSSYCVLFFNVQFGFIFNFMDSVCFPPYLIFIIQTHAYRQSMQCRVLKKIKKKKPSRFGAAFET